MATTEHELLRYFALKGGTTSRLAVEEFGGARKLTRGAIVKMIDRLYKKGLLARKVVDHVFVYEPAKPIEAIEANYVKDFVQSRLRGSVAPLLAFLSESGDLSPEESDAVHQIAERIEREE